MIQNFSNTQYERIEDAMTMPWAEANEQDQEMRDDGYELRAGASVEGDISFVETELSYSNTWSDVQKNLGSAAIAPHILRFEDESKGDIRQVGLWYRPNSESSQQ